MRFTDRVLSLPPAVITVVFVLLYVGGGVMINVVPFGLIGSVVFSAAMLLLIGPLMFWHYCLYRAASERSAEWVGHRGRRGFLFVLAIAGTGAHLVLWPIATATDASASGYETLMTLQAVATFVSAFSCFGAIWAAANALCRFDERARSVEIHKTLGTFLLELYLPIGIWVIYRRIRRMLAQRTL